MRQKPLHRLLNRVVLLIKNTISDTPTASSPSGIRDHTSVLSCNNNVEHHHTWNLPWRVSMGGEDSKIGLMKQSWALQSWRGFAAPSQGGSKGGKGGEGENNNKSDRRINRAIVARTVRLVGTDGHEILTRFEALNKAQQAGLDLVEVDGKSDPPVCKLMDFSKEKFKVKRQEKDLRKKQLEKRRLDDLKEVRFSCRTEQKDLELKADIVTRLLLRGHRVKVVVQFQGQDKGEEVGVPLLEKAMSLLQAEMKVENGPRIERMRAWIMIRPVAEEQQQKSTKKKSIEPLQEAGSSHASEEDTDLHVQVKAVA